MEERAKQTKMEGVIEVNVYKWFGNVKNMSGNRLPWSILKWETVGRKEKSKEIQMEEVRRRVTKHGLRVENRRDRERGKTQFWGN